MGLRGIRGATTVGANNVEDILDATRELLEVMKAENGFAPEDLAAVWFTVTGDLNAAFPAQAARKLGWRDVPLMDAVEIPVPGSLTQCIRVLVLWNSEVSQSAIRHIYLNGAQVLRPDLAKGITREDSK
ncbi:MAG: chorismate mutase [Anaerolineae bacterium]